VGYQEQEVKRSETEKVEQRKVAARLFRLTASFLLGVWCGYVQFVEEVVSQKFAG
jgi:hypothetical protein